MVEQPDFFSSTQRDDFDLSRLIDTLTHGPVVLKRGGGNFLFRLAEITFQMYLRTHARTHARTRARARDGQAGSTLAAAALTGGALWRRRKSLGRMRGARKVLLGTEKARDQFVRQPYFHSARVRITHTVGATVGASCRESQREMLCTFTQRYRH